MDFFKWLRVQWDRVGAWVCIVAGAVALLLGWIGVSGTALPSAQIPYILSGGIVGIFLMGVGAMLWLSADLRDEWQKLDGVEDAIRSLDPSHLPDAQTRDGLRDRHASDTDVAAN
jgi:hypothetical protein